MLDEGEALKATSSKELELSALLKSIQLKLNLYVRVYIYKYKSKHTRQRSAVATQSFTPVGDLQATDISNLLQRAYKQG